MGVPSLYDIVDNPEDLDSAMHKVNVISCVGLGIAVIVCIVELVYA